MLVPSTRVVGGTGCLEFGSGKIVLIRFIVVGLAITTAAPLGVFAALALAGGEKTIPAGGPVGPPAAVTGS